ncbi:MAG: hypothetical protein H6661_04095 [Ardenticatenaceae bacterium]|nr:hypothetical protein [Ardenticatenaceae bacterium]
MKTDKERSRLVYALKNLPENGRRLPGGLALRITRGNGMAVLGCSRVGVAPSETEMEVIVEAVVEAFEPAAVWLANQPVRKEVARLADGDETAVVEIHYIWRVYWPEEKMRLAWRPSAEQMALL